MFGENILRLSNERSHRHTVTLAKAVALQALHSIPLKVKIIRFNSCCFVDCNSISKRFSQSIWQKK